MWDDLARPPLRRGPVAAGGRWRVDVVARTGSTNADLAARCRRGEARAGHVLVAEEQDGGRGRLGRAWSSPPRAGLTFSAVLDGPPSGWVALLAGVAVAEALTGFAEVPARLKWPNDVLIEDRKVAGLLAEAAGGLVVLGIGLNVTTRAEELPGPAATSLALEGARVLDRSSLLLALLRSLDREHGPEDYRRLCSTIGRQVRVELPGGRQESGTAEAIDEDGCLVVDGRPYAAGDVVHLRPR